MCLCGVCVCVCVGGGGGGGGGGRMMTAIALKSDANPISDLSDCTETAQISKKGYTFSIGNWNSIKHGEPHDTYIYKVRVQSDNSIFD